MEIKALFAVHENKFLYPVQTADGLKVFRPNGNELSQNKDGLKVFRHNGNELSQNKWVAADTAYTTRYNDLLAIQNAEKAADLAELNSIYSPTLAGKIFATIVYPPIELVRLVERDEQYMKWVIVDSVYKNIIDNL